MCILIKKSLPETKLMEYEELLQNVPQISISIDEAVTTWYNGWIEERLYYPNFMQFTHQKYNV